MQSESETPRRRLRTAALLAVVLAQAPPSAPQSSPPTIPRGFTFDTPLFHARSAWNQDATTAAVLPQSSAQILATYKVLCGDTTGLHPISDPPTTSFPYPDVTYDEYTLPIFEAGTGQQSVSICDYEGIQAYPGPKWSNNVLGGPIDVPACAGSVRPSAPGSIDSDGHLILFDASTSIAYEFWQATTSRAGPCQSHGGAIVGPSIFEAGAADWFDTRGDGSNPDGVSSARAVGTPLLGGMILPEDVKGGSIAHALAVAIPGPRNLSPDPEKPLGMDYFYPAATTETDYFSTNASALAAGQRLRLRSTIVDATGAPVDETSDLAPITRMFVAALRTYGAYVVDNASGFTFYAEDINTAVLDLTDAEVNGLIGEPPATPLPSDKTKWQLVIERLNDDLWTMLPFAYGSCAGAGSTVATANFEVVEPATRIPAGSTLVPTDFDGDGVPDILWRNPTTGGNVIWYLRDGGRSTRSAKWAPTAAASWVIGGVADFDGDGVPDILWRNPSTGRNAIWYMQNNGTSTKSARWAPAVATGWLVGGLADFDGDGVPDILWRNPSMGKSALWYMQDEGRSAKSAAWVTSASVSWEIAGIADFDADGTPDILWRNPSTGKNALWYMQGNGTSARSAAWVPTVAAGWVVGKVADFDRDQIPDILWRNPGTGNNALWYMQGDGTSVRSSAWAPTASIDWDVGG